MILDFRLVKPRNDDVSSRLKRLELTWAFPLKKGGETAKTIKLLLEGLHGVEFVNLQRYTADVCYAPHVVEPEDLAEDIAASLADDPDIVHQYNKVEARKEYGAAERVEVEYSISL